MSEEPPPSYESATLDGKPRSSTMPKGQPKITYGIPDGHPPAVQPASHPPIAPRIFVRPEFATITRSSDPTQQLTCVVTVELPSRPPTMDPVCGTQPITPPHTPESHQDFHGSQNLSDHSGFADTTPNRPPSPNSLASSVTYAYNATPVPPIAGPSLDSLSEDLRNRVIDWKGHPLSGLGQLQMFDLLTVRRDALLREFHVYLFKDAILCLIEEKKRRHGLSRLLSSASSSTKQAKSALRLKGRIYIHHIKQVKETSDTGELSLTINMEDDRLDSFILIFKDRASLETWRTHIAELVESCHGDPLTIADAKNSASATYADNATSSPHKAGSSSSSIIEDLRSRITNWKGHPLSGLGQLHMFDLLGVRRDSLLREFYVYLFKEAILCVVEKKRTRSIGRLLSSASGSTQQTQCDLPLELKGRIHIRHVKQVTETSTSGELSLTIHMRDERLDSFFLVFKDRSSLETWRAQIVELIANTRIAELVVSSPISASTSAQMNERESCLTVMECNEDGHTDNPPPNQQSRSPDVVSPHLSVDSDNSLPALRHTPLDLILVVSLPPPTANQSAGALKHRIIKTALDFVLATLGPNDRLSIVTFEVGLGGRVRKTPFLCSGLPQEHMRLAKFVGGIGARDEADEDEFMVPTAKDKKTGVVTGVTHGLDAVLQCKTRNAISGMMVVSDVADGIRRAQLDPLLTRTEAANVPIHSFGYGRSHDAASLWLMSNHTSGTYTFVKDWYDLGDCLAGCLGGMMSIGLLHMKIHMKTVDGRRFRIRQVSGGTSSIAANTGHAVEVDVGELRYGERKEMLVELELDNIHLSHETPEGMMEEVPVFEADGEFFDPAAGKHVSRLSHPVLHTITLLPQASRAAPTKPSATSDPVLVRRRMELLTSETITRALVLAHKNMQEAQQALSSTTGILRTVLQNISQSLPPPGNPTVRNSKDNLAVSAVQALEAVLADLQVLAEGLREDVEVFTHDQRHFGAQLAMILRNQTSWTGRTSTEKLFWKAENSIELVTRSADWVRRERERL